MENKFRPEDEIDYKDFLKNPLRLFAIVYPYLIMLIIVVGMYWVFNLDYAYLNTQPRQLLARDTVAPEISLLMPEDNITLNRNTISFSYDVVDKNNVTCIFNLNGNNEELTSKDFMKDLGNNNYNWYVGCVDIVGNSNISEQRSFNVNYIHSPSIEGSGGGGSGGGGGGGSSGGGSSSSSGSSSESVSSSIIESSINEEPKTVEKPVIVKEEQ